MMRKDLEQMPLVKPSSEEWVNTALANFDEFLVDHAICERKASGMAISLATKFPQCDPLVEPMIALAREELAHFHEVFCLLRKRGKHLRTSDNDPYMKFILKHCSHAEKDFLLDKLMVFAIVEARGCERFHLIADALEDEELKNFYHQLGRVEAGHHRIFIRISKDLFGETRTLERLGYFSQIEQNAIDTLPIRAAVH